MPRHPSQHREEEIETWIEGLGVDESMAADLATQDDTEDDSDAAPHDDRLDVEATNLPEVHLGTDGSGKPHSALPAYCESPPGMLSSDTESRMCSPDLTTPVQA